MNAREKLVELLTEFYGSDPMYYGVDASAIAQHLIDNGVKPVVRCKDCIHSYDDLCGLCCAYGVCVDCIVQPEFYCADGKRKEDK